MQTMHGLTELGDSPATVAKAHKYTTLESSERCKSSSFTGGGLLTEGGQVLLGLGSGGCSKTPRGI